jgi:hypothetical protein
MVEVEFCETFGINNIINPMTTTCVSHYGWMATTMGFHFENQGSTSLPTPYVCQLYIDHIHIVYSP